MYFVENFLLWQNSGNALCGPGSGQNIFTAVLSGGEAAFY